MKRIFLALSVTGVFLLFGCCCTASPEPGSFAYSMAQPGAEVKKSKPLPGVELTTCLLPDYFGRPQSICIAAVDLNYQRNGKAWRPGLEYCGKTRETVRTLAERAKADVAVNASFFAFTKPPEAPRAAAYFKVDGQMHGETRPNRPDGGAIMFNAGEKPQIVRFDEEKAGEYAYVLQSFPLLLENGEVFEKYRDDIRHPRTMVGLTADNKMLLITVDGRHPEKAGGMTYKEQALLCRELGCVTALNLDGGGSTTLVVKGKVINYPSDNKKFDHDGSRKVNDIFCFRFE